MNHKLTMELEKRVMRRMVKDLLAAGYELSVYDGEGEETERSTEFKTIFEAMRTCDDDYLFVYKTGEKDRYGWVRFIYGNDGWDVINDYTVNLEPHMAGVNAIADRYS